MKANIANKSIWVYPQLKTSSGGLSNPAERPGGTCFHFWHGLEKGGYGIIALLPICPQEAQLYITVMEGIHKS